MGGLISMKLKHYTINIILSFVLIAMVTNQALWVRNMYNSYEKEIILEINKTLEKAVYMEVSERTENMGGFSSYSLSTEDGDTSRYIQKEIQTPDTTFVVNIDRQDPNAYLRILQYIYKVTNYSLIDVKRINAIFRDEMLKGKYPVQSTSIEYYDLPMEELLETTEPDSGFSSYISSDMITIDILDSMGVKAYVDSPLLTILGRMIFQLAVSIALIIIAIIGLFFLGRTIYMQWKQEKMRQTAINSMTHEFKRPISTSVSMISLISFYLDNNNPEKAVQYADDTIQELNKLTAYTERIQQISNNDKSTVYLDKSDLDINPWFDTVCKKYYSTGDKDSSTPGKKVDIQLNLKTVHAQLYAEKLHFANVMDNLIENAIKYSENDVLVKITMTDVNGFVRISVKDNGMGISKSDKKYIFEKYYRSHNHAAQRKTGFGLGLTYVKSIVEAHNGKIEVESEIGKGTEFIILLPVRQNNN